MKNRRWLWIGLAAAAVVVVIVVWSLIARARGSATADLQTTAAVMGSLTAQVGATGSVHANQAATLVFQTTGTVDEVKVAAGESVAKGEVLATLERTSLGANVILAQADLVAAERALEELQTSATAKAQAELAMANAEKALKDEEYRWRVQQQGNRASPETIRDAKAKLVLAEDDVDRYKALYDQASGESAKALAQVNLVAAQQRRDSALRNLNWYLGKPTDNDQAILDAKLAVAKAQFEDAVRAWERVKDGPNADDVSAAQARVDAARASVELGLITAPFEGTVTFGRVKPGDIVTLGSPAFGLADLTRLFVDVDIPEVDIDRIRLGQDVSLTFDSVPNNLYTGVVTDVGRVGTSVQGVVSFEVEVEVLKPDASIKPGMTAAVNIVVSQIDNVLLVPNRAVRVQDGKRVIFVMRDGVPTTVEVTLGSSSDTDSEVVGGDLKVGDVIVLNPPLLFSQNGPPGFVRGMGR
ncbi:MAG: HlyD family efflux transporter periplasmic adaptor subunit [Chloroflexi bacterium]|nr:HlyD family efflux transporter periplasmic adaptor subunit [Chloroflexota bacterium]